MLAKFTNIRMLILLYPKVVWLKSEHRKHFELYFPARQYYSVGNNFISLNHTGYHRFQLQISHFYSVIYLFSFWKEKILEFNFFLFYRNYGFLNLPLPPLKSNPQKSWIIIPYLWYRFGQRIKLWFHWS